MKRKCIVLLLTFTMLTMMVAGCSTPATTGASTTTSAGITQTTGGTTEIPAPKPFKVGFLDQDSQAPAVTRMRNIVKSVVETAGGEMISDITGGFAADSQLNAIEKLISAGVSGIVITPAADSMLPAAIRMCEDAKVYLSITFRSIQDPEVAKIVKASPYYAGNAYEDEFNAGYKVMTDTFAQRPNVKQIAIISLPVGDNTADAREAGIRKACEENGAEIVAEVRNIEQASDGTEAVESLVAAFPELDCIFAVSCYVPSAITALPGALKKLNVSSDKICLSGCDTGDDLSVMMDSGYAASFCGGHLEIDRCAAATICVNAILGTPLGGTAGPVQISIPYLFYRTSADVELYGNFVEGSIPIYTPEEIKSMLLPYYNPALTAQKVIDQLQAWSLEDVSTRHAALK